MRVDGHNCLVEGCIKKVIGFVHLGRTQPTDKPTINYVGYCEDHKHEMSFQTGIPICPWCNEVMHRGPVTSSTYEFYCPDHPDLVVHRMWVGGKLGSIPLPEEMPI